MREILMMPMKSQGGPALLPPTSLMTTASAVPPERRLRLQQPPEPRAAITPRQRQVLYCLIEGKPTKRICQELGMSEGTAKVHIGAIFRALRVNNRTQATLAALQQGWIYPEMWSRS